MNCTREDNMEKKILNGEMGGDPHINFLHILLLDSKRHSSELWDEFSKTKLNNPNHPSPEANAVWIANWYRGRLAVVRGSKASCAVCGHEGKYCEEIIDVDFIDCTGRESVHLECKDVESCLDRKEKRILL